MLGEAMQWAAKHGVSGAAMAELSDILNCYAVSSVAAAFEEKTLEAKAQAEVMVNSADHGYRLFRNNSGAMKDSESGAFVRFGLGNTSKKLNELVKSHDLIGWRTVVIQPEHVGSKIAQFVSVEMKRPGWSYKGTKREKAQKRWGDAVNIAGGFSTFATNVEDLNV